MITNPIVNPRYIFGGNIITDRFAQLAAEMAEIGKEFSRKFDDLDLRQMSVDSAIREENKAAIEKLLLHPFILTVDRSRKEPEKLKYKRAPRKQRPP